MSEFSNRWKGVGFALLAAVLFGLSTPLAKSLSPHVHPVLLAGLLYLGSGIGLSVYSLACLGRKHSGKRETALKRADAPWLVGAIVTGGMVGPLLLMWGLLRKLRSNRNARGREVLFDGENFCALLRSEMKGTG